MSKKKSPSGRTDHSHKRDKAAPAQKQRFEEIWRNKWLTSNATCLDEMIDALKGAACTLCEMRDAGVVLEDTGGVCDDYATLVTYDPAVAERFGFQPAEPAEPAEDQEADLKQQALAAGPGADRPRQDRLPGVPEFARQ